MDISNRTELLLGGEAMRRLREARIILFGVGGVGSWCAEGLIRDGVEHLTIVDNDIVSPSNLNRQLMATAATLGKPKTEALRGRLLEINPDADIVAVQKAYSPENSAEFGLSGYDYILDAIDSLRCKAELILRACETGATFFSSMGAALKVDATRVGVAEFFDVEGCPLGAALRKRLRRAGTLPAKKFLCVFSDEVLENHGSQEAALTDAWSPRKAVTNGTTAHVTAVFGMTLAGLVVQDVCAKAWEGSI